MKFAFIDAEKAHHPVGELCKCLEVSRSGFYAWKKREESAKARRDRQLAAKIKVLFAATGSCYGSPRIYQELLAQGEKVGRKRVARLMREQGLVGRHRRRFRRTTDSNHDHPIAPNVLDRSFDVDRPNQVWAADITYVRTWEGWLYLAVVMDLFSRRVVGWALADHLKRALPLEAYRRAVTLRRPPEGMMHHSDRGTQYASDLYRKELEKNGAIQSMSRKADCWDIAVVESFFATLKQERIYKKSWPTHASARRGIGEYIDQFYNVSRRHSALGYMSPLDYKLADGQHKVAA